MMKKTSYDVSTDDLKDPIKSMMSEDDIPEPSIHVVNSGRVDEEADIRESGLKSGLNTVHDEDDDESENECKEKAKYYDPEETKQRQEDKNARSIFVGNLPSTVKRRDVRKHFKNCGDIESVRLRGIIPEKLSQSKKVAAITKTVHEKCKSIYGYVVFRAKNSVTKALELNTSQIGDNFITVQRLGKTIFDKDVTVFIGNLTADVQENQIRDFFADCGKIEGVRVVRDSKTGIGKGFAFVSFSSNDGVILALEKNGLDFNKRDIRIMKAGQPRKKLTKKDFESNSENAKRRRQAKKTSQTRQEYIASYSGTKTGKGIPKKKKSLKAKKQLEDKKKIKKLLTS